MSFAIQSNVSRKLFNPYAQTKKSADTDFEKEFSGSATSASTSSGKGKNIGIMTIGSCGFIAQYADSSTEQEPIVKVGNYDIRINDVDPQNATRIEMFALLSYLDDKGLIQNHGMKSYNKMMTSAMQAEYNGFCECIYDESSAYSLRRDWIAILNNAIETFFNIPETYKQALDSQNIITCLEKWKADLFKNKLSI